MRNGGYSAEQLWEILARRALAIAGALLAFYGVAIAIVQVVAWLKSGQWSPVSVAMLFLVPPAVEPEFPLPYSLIPTWFFSERVGTYIVEAGPNTWLGLRSIILWLLNLPLSLASFVAGVWLAAVQVSGMERLNQARRRATHT